MSLDKEQFEQLKDFLADQQRDLMLANRQSSNSEVSGLHREILTQIKEVKEVVDSHDITIREVTGIMPDIAEALKAYKATSTLGKGVVAVILGVPALAAFVGGIIYFVNLSEK